MFLRCFVDTHGKPYDDTYRIEPQPTDPIHLVLDYDKKLDYGTCIIWINKKISKVVLFCIDNTKQSCIKKLKSSKYTVLSRKEFVEKVFFPYVYRARAKCIGFELPFILSRLATDVTESRRHPNGFSLTLSERVKFPHVVIKSIDSKSQFIEFNKTFRKKKQSIIPYYRGCFVDCKTMGFVLTNNSYTLKSAILEFDVPIIGESVNNVLAIYSLYNKLMNRYKMFCLDKLENKLFSPASIGVSYLEKIGVKPFLKQNPDFSKDMLGKIMSTYYGARVEARIVNNPTLTTILDFASMYPTLFALFGMYSLLIAEKIDHKTTTNEIREFLDKITISEINKPETWKNMLTICKIVPDEDILPVRSDYSKNILNVGLNHLKSNDGTTLWFTLPDLITSKLLTGKTPKIIESITFFPQGVQSGLKDIEILPDITLKKDDDLFKKLIETRFAIKKQKQTKELDQLQKILKIIANSTCYGKFIQLDTRSTILEKKVTVYGLDTFDAETFKLENPAKFFHPIISVFLTAGSRLILAAAEHLLEQNNGYMMYCDTDSVFVSPQHTKLIQDFFRPLNPYNIDDNMEMFKIQEEDGRKLEKVWCLAFSSKRYAVYEYQNDTITILKYSNHALGHYLTIDPKEFWHDMILLWYYPEKEEEITSKYETKYAISELVITQYSFLRSFDGVNHGKKYSQRVKPYDTILVGTACRKDTTGMPIIPFVPRSDNNLDAIPFMPFVDKSGRKYPNPDSLDSVEYWKKMSLVFSEYRNHRETKLDSSDSVVQRKHLVFSKESIKYVGKEIHDLEESTIFGASKNNSIMYENEQERLRRIIENMTEEKARELGISRRSLFYWKQKIRDGKLLGLKKNIIEKILS